MGLARANLGRGARLGWAGALALVWSQAAAWPPDVGANRSDLRSYAATGVVMEVRAEARTVVVRHGAISNYMAAMTMPFHVQESKELAGLERGDEISFRLLVAEDRSWIDQVARLGRVRWESPPPVKAAGIAAPRPQHPLMDYKFTNELNQAVSLADFRGQALAITFFFTRCPVPDYCPRLSKNFQEASRKLKASPGGPTNWHFLSVSFDPAFDTPAVLKGYGQIYGYDPAHWSFLTGPAERIAELARLSDATFEPDGAGFNHNFRTLIIDAQGRLQTMFPIGGDLSDSIVEEIRKAVAPGTNSAALTRK